MGVFARAIDAGVLERAGPGVGLLRFRALVPETDAPVIWGLMGFVVAALLGVDGVDFGCEGLGGADARGAAGVRVGVADDALLLAAILPPARTGAVAGVDPACRRLPGFVLIFVVVFVDGVGWGAEGSAGEGSDTEVDGGIGSESDTAAAVGPTPALSPEINIDGVTSSFSPESS